MLDEIICVKDQFYILATSSLADDRTRVIKHGDTFAVLDRYGDITPVGLREQGLYHQGTRFLSHLVLELHGTRPMLLNSSISQDADLLVVDMTNPDIYVHGDLALPRGILHISRSKFLWQGVSYERLVFSNYDRFPVQVRFSLEFSADFADIFEVRGMRRARRGRLLEPVVNEEAGCAILEYEGLDGVLRQTRLCFSPRPRRLSASEAHFEARLEPKQKAEFFVSVVCDTSTCTNGHDGTASFSEAYASLSRSLEAARSEDCDSYTSNEQFNDWANRSLKDLHMMVTDTLCGPYPYAGVPWFSTPFGRDGIITALEMLWVNPGIARGVLCYLAATQAREVAPEQEAEPGKIIHEVRAGEMAALGEIPFGRYYGSVDVTPLFVALAAAYYEHTGDRVFIDAIWPNILLALRWIDEYGDLDGDGFVEYSGRSHRGLTNQGWKDSEDSVFHADGTLAEGPIALCEVQGYVYMAKRAASELARVLGHAELARKLALQAHVLKQRFHAAFWDEELSTYILALDGKKRPCRVKTSNAGHALFSGIASRAHAERVVRTLMAPDSFSGWGIRTVATSEARYNPMSYHNGSVWPHDNALIARGMASYGFKDAAMTVFTGLFDAAIAMEAHRLPELFCGFPRVTGDRPTIYPIACSPQSWSSAAVFMLLQSCLGLTVRGAHRQVYLYNPALPESIQAVRIRDLKVGNGSVDLDMQRYPTDVVTNLVRRKGDVGLVVVKGR